MKIVITSYPFFPETGGIESHTALLAEHLVQRGHAVTVLTCTGNQQEDEYAYNVVRQPRMRQTYAVLQGADLIIQNHPSISLGWPLFVLQKPTITIHQTWLTDQTLYSYMTLPIKNLLIQQSSNVSNSAALSRRLNVPCEPIGNSYDDKLFNSKWDVSRSEDWLVVARLVSDKGVDLAIRALSEYIKYGKSAHLTIVGDGPERETLKCLARELGVLERVNFKGILRGSDLAKEYSRHRICIIPSRWEEPFGIVALEALACGCRLICSSRGGLSEAAGVHALYFNNGSLVELVERLFELSECSGWSCEERSSIESHLKYFSVDVYFNRICRQIDQIIK